MMDRASLERSLKTYEAFADVTPPGRDRDVFRAIADDMRRQLGEMEAAMPSFGEAPEVG